MSSKNRRNRRRDQRRNQHLNRPRGSGGLNAAPLSQNRGTKTKTLVVVAVLLIAGLIVYAFSSSKPKSVVAAVHKPTAAPALQAAAPAARAVSVGPRIEFAKAIYDFGKVNGDELVNCEFVFTNTGNTSLELSEVTPACGCMKIGQWSHKVEPGNAGTIAVQYDSHHYTGVFAKSVFVTCNDSNQPKPILEIKGLVWRPIEINPPYATIE